LLVSDGWDFEADGLRDEGSRSWLIQALSEERLWVQPQRGREDSLADFFEAFEKMMSQSPLLDVFVVSLIFD
jgi:hypothetical protein